MFLEETEKANFFTCRHYITLLREKQTKGMDGYERWYASNGLVSPINSPLMVGGMFESDLMGGAGEGVVRKRT